MYNLTDLNIWEENLIRVWHVWIEEIWIREWNNTSGGRIRKPGFILYFLRNRTQSWCPYISAIRTGLSPQQSSLSIGACRECSSRSTASRPDSAAEWAGVHPCSVLRHGLAPCSMRILTVSVWPVEKASQCDQAPAFKSLVIFFTLVF